MIRQLSPLSFLAARDRNLLVEVHTHHSLGSQACADPLSTRVALSVHLVPLPGSHAPLLASHIPPTHCLVQLGACYKHKALTPSSHRHSTLANSPGCSSTNCPPTWYPSWDLRLPYPTAGPAWSLPVNYMCTPLHAPSLGKVKTLFFQRLAADRLSVTPLLLQLAVLSPLFTPVPPVAGFRTHTPFPPHWLEAETPCHIHYSSWHCRPGAPTPTAWLL